MESLMSDEGYIQSKNVKDLRRDVMERIPSSHLAYKLV